MRSCATLTFQCFCHIKTDATSKLFFGFSRLALDRASFRQNFAGGYFAGFSSAAIVIPQGVAFAAIAGLPPEYGLSTAMITAALRGSSMVMISGPTTAISAVLLSSLTGMAEPRSTRFIELALMMTILVGIIQMLAGIARLGGLVSFVSHSVMTAFTTSAAILIGASQLPGAFGIDAGSGGNVVERLHRFFVDVDHSNWVSIAVSMSTLGWRSCFNASCRVCRVSC